MIDSEKTNEGTWVINTLKNISKVREKIEKHHFLINLICFYFVYAFMIFVHHSLRELVILFLEAQSKHWGTWYHTIWKGFDSFFMNEIFLLGFLFLITTIVLVVRDNLSQKVKWYFLRVFTIFVGVGFLVHTISIFLHFIISPIQPSSP